jgi:hypothetical protein
MFLWVSMMLTELDGAPSAGDFREILRDGPENIKGLYQRIIRRLETRPAGQKAWIRLILSWAILAKRQLTLSELEAGVGISHSLTTGNPCVDNFYNFETTMSLCSSIIQVIEHTERGSNKPRKHVSVVHDGIKQFLTSKMADTFYVDPLHGNKLLARTCLHQIVDELLKKPSVRSEIFFYSSLFFSQHRTSVEFECDEFDLLMKEFLAHFKHWLGILLDTADDAQVRRFLDCSHRRL